MKYVVQKPKTEKGICFISMTEETTACFRRILANWKNPKLKPMVDGYIRFLFLDKNKMPLVALHWEKVSGAHYLEI